MITCTWKDYVVRLEWELDEVNRRSEEDSRPAINWYVTIGDWSSPFNWYDGMVNAFTDEESEQAELVDCIRSAMRREIHRLSAAYAAVSRVMSWARETGNYDLGLPAKKEYDRLKFELDALDDVTGDLSLGPRMKQMLKEVEAAE